MSEARDEIDEEIEILEEKEKKYFRKEKVYPFIKNQAFKSGLTSFPTSVCAHCGSDYRITHLCDLKTDFVWLDDWKNKLLSHFKSQLPEDSIQSQPSNQTSAEYYRSQQTESENKYKQLNSQNQGFTAENQSTTNARAFGFCCLFLVIGFFVFIFIIRAL